MWFRRAKTRLPIPACILCSLATILRSFDQPMTKVNLPWRYWDGNFKTSRSLQSSNWVIKGREENSCSQTREFWKTSRFFISNKPNINQSTNTKQESKRFYISNNLAYSQRKQSKADTASPACSQKSISIGEIDRNPLRIYHPHHCKDTVIILTVAAIN